MEPILRVASERKCIEDGRVEVTERPDGTWMWRCSLHGESAFFSKTQADAEAEAEWVHIARAKTLARMYIDKMREELRRRREKGE